MARNISLKKMRDRFQDGENTPIEYVIYARKSTDESSGKQVQSIADQIKLCVKYAKENKLLLKHRDDLLSDYFETKQEIENENNDPDEKNREVYSTTRDFFVIKEQFSAKVPGERPKRKRLIELVKKGKIKGLLSYSPDRQARNALEGGEIIDLVDREMIDLKYTNFHFENSAAGKMMLGVWFVLSKQYSDKISEDVNRGLNSKSEKGKSFGVYKYGYTIDLDPDTLLYNGFHKPHPEYFDLIKKAFHLKLYEKRSDEFIANQLVERGFKRDHRGKVTDFKYSNSFYEIWLDPFYYGIFQYGSRESDLRETNPHYKPAINEDEYKVLLQRHYGEVEYQTLVSLKQEHQEIMPFPEGFVKMDDGTVLTMNIPNKQRFYKKLEKEKLTRPNIVLSDVINPSQIRYTNHNKKSESYKFEITYDKIESSICEMLDTISISDEIYEKYVVSGKRKLEEIFFTASQERSKLNLQYGKISKAQNDLIKINLGRERSAEEDSIYYDELSKYNKSLDKIEGRISDLNKTERNQLLEVEIFVDILRKMSAYYRSANYVQRRQISKILFSNIIITKKRQVLISPLPGLSSIFSTKYPLNQGRQDSNSRRGALETPALPLSYGPLLG